MKKLLVIAIALTAINAQATRARVTALANSPHLIDTQTVYSNPADIHYLGDYVTIESGSTDTSSTTTAKYGNAEGMVVRSMGDAKMGLSLGHNSENASSWGLRNTALGVSASLARNQQNPLELTYGAKSGDMGWAGTLVYSNWNDKKNDVKESSLGVRLGARTGNWDAALRLGLANTVENTTAGKYTGTLAVGASGGYMWDQIYFNGSFSTVGFKVESTTGNEVLKYSATSIRLGAMTTVKKDGSEFFYGASLAQSAQKEDKSDTKIDTLGLPVFVGFEADAASWLTIRGSVTQTVQLLHNTKTSSGGATTVEASPADGDTTMAAGLGLKFNKVTVDGTLFKSVGAATTSNQQIDGNNLLAQVGMTYMF